MVYSPYDFRYDKRDCYRLDYEAEAQRQLYRDVSTTPIEVNDNGAGYHLKFILENIFDFLGVSNTTFGNAIQICGVPILFTIEWVKYNNDNIGKECAFLTICPENDFTSKVQKICKIIETIITNCPKYTCVLQPEEPPTWGRYRILIQRGG